MASFEKKKGTTNIILISKENASLLQPKNPKDIRIKYSIDIILC